MNRHKGGDAISGGGLAGKGQEAGAEGSRNHWGWASLGEEEALSLPLPPQLVWAFASSFWAPPCPPAPGHRSLAQASETWEPSLPTTPTVLESGEQMPLLAKQLLKQTACFRAIFSEAVSGGVGRCVYR